MSEHLETLYALELALAQRNETAIDGGYEAVLAPAFVEFGQSGRRWVRAETLAAMATEAQRDDIAIDGFQIAMLAPDVVLATYDLTADADGLPRRSRRSSIWVRADGRWQMRFHQGTPVDRAPR